MKLKIALVAVSLLVAGSANAAVVTSIQISNSNGIAGQGYLQVAEVGAYTAGGTDVALASQGATATATSVYFGGSADPSHAIDGDVTGNYPNIYHGQASDGSDILTVTLAAATDITKLSIFGRTDCCSYRDIYSFNLFNGTSNVGSGTIDATGATHVGFAMIAAVPEPATWALMIGGFGLVGGAMRRRKPNLTVSYA